MMDRAGRVTKGLVGLSGSGCPRRRSAHRSDRGRPGTGHPRWWFPGVRRWSLPTGQRLHVASCRCAGMLVGLVALRRCGRHRSARRHTSRGRSGQKQGAGPRASGSGQRPAAQRSSSAPPAWDGAGERRHQASGSHRYRSSGSSTTPTARPARERLCRRVTSGHAAGCGVDDQVRSSALRLAVGDCRAPPRRRHPLARVARRAWALAQRCNTQPRQARIIRPGEVLFLPVGAAHSVAHAPVHTTSSQTSEPQTARMAVATVAPATAGSPTVAPATVGPPTVVPAAPAAEPEPPTPASSAVAPAAEPAPGVAAPPVPAAPNPVVSASMAGAPEAPSTQTPVAARARERRSGHPRHQTGHTTCRCLNDPPGTLCTRAIRSDSQGGRAGCRECSRHGGYEGRAPRQRSIVHRVDRSRLVSACGARHLARIAPAPSPAPPGGRRLRLPGSGLG